MGAKDSAGSLTDDLEVRSSIATVRKLVEDRLREAILSGRFAPGDHLSDRRLCDTFKVSRTVVREAVRQLESERLVTSIPHRGSFVRTFSDEDAAQIYEVRSYLEALAARDFVRNAGKEDRAALEKVFAEICAFRPAESSKSILDLKQNFYQVMLRGGKNSYVSAMLNQILNQNAQLRATTLSDPERLPQTIKELSLLMEAIRARDPDAAWQASYDHVRQAGKVALSILKRQRERADSEPAGT